MAIISRLVSDFIGHGPEVTHNGQQVRPEVKVSIISGKVLSFTEKNGNMNFTFNIDGAEHNMNGFVNSDEVVAKIINLAKEKDEVLCVRFEKKRKKNVDPTLPIQDISKTLDIARENVVKTIAGVYDYNNEKWILVRGHQTNPNEDPESILDNVKQLNFNSESFFDNKSQAPTVRVSKSKEDENAENALMTMYFFLSEQEALHGYKLDKEKKREYSKKLLKLANMIQVSKFGLNGPVYSDYSHTRARYLIFKWTEVISPLNEQAINNFGAWAKSLATNGGHLWEWCAQESKNL